MKISIIDTYDIDAYNAVAHHPLQSWQWGEARRVMGTEIVRIGIFDDADALTNVILMTVHPLPKTPWKIGYVPRSPIPSPELTAFMQEYVTQNNIVFVKWEPDVAKTEESKGQIAALQKSFPFQRSPHQLFPDWTMELDISASEDELMQQMKSKTRYNVRLAARKGVTVSEVSTDEGFKTFSDLYFETTARQKYYGHNREYHSIVWEQLKDSLAHILIAYYEGEPLAAYELFLFNGKLYYPYGGSTARHKNVMAANLLMWEAIRFGKAHDTTIFDMWGATHPGYEGDDIYAGFTRFKEGYNAQFKEMIGSYDLITNKAVYHLYSIIHRLRSWYLGI